jgi:hypothetical protein
MNMVGGGIGRGLRLDLHRHSNLAVPKNAHGHTRVDIEGSKQRSVGLAGAVHGDPRRAGGDDAAVDAAVEVAR